MQIFGVLFFQNNGSLFYTEHHRKLKMFLLVRTFSSCLASPLLRGEEGGECKHQSKHYRGGGRGRRNFIAP